MAWLLCLSFKMKYLAVLAVVAVIASAEAHIKGIHPIIRNGWPTGRITGGVEVAPHSRPFQVALEIPYQGKSAFCGGTLISDEWVLTAAHCGELSSNVTVILGAHNLTDADEARVVISSDKVIVHQGWDQTTLINDIAVIHLSEKVTLNENISAARLPSRDQQNNKFAGETGTASGWGLDSDASENISPVLRSVDVPVLTNLECRAKFGIIGIVIPLHESNVCIDGAEGKSTCNGDSGGPLTIQDADGEPTHIGTTSFGIALGCEKNYPAVFTRTTSYLDWISLETGIQIPGDK